MGRLTCGSWPEAVGTWQSASVVRPVAVGMGCWRADRDYNDESKGRLWTFTLMLLRMIGFNRSMKPWAHAVLAD